MKIKLLVWDVITICRIFFSLLWRSSVSAISQTFRCYRRRKEHKDEEWKLFNTLLFLFFLSLIYICKSFWRLFSENWAYERNRRAVCDCEMLFPREPSFYFVLLEACTNELSAITSSGGKTNKSYAATSDVDEWCERGLWYIHFEWSCGSFTHTNAFMKHNLNNTVLE